MSEYQKINLSTLRGIIAVLDNNNLSHLDITWDECNRRFIVHFGKYDVWFYPTIKQLEIRGDNLPQTHKLPWNRWLSYCEASIAFKHIDIEWWRKNRMVLRAIALQFEIPANDVPEDQKNGQLKDLAGVVDHVASEASDLIGLVNIPDHVFAKMSVQAKLNVINHNICALANEVRENGQTHHSKEVRK